MILIKNGTLYDAVTPEAQRADILVGDDGKITAEQVRQTVVAHRNDSSFEHMVQPKMVYISNPTEIGTIYKKAELEALYQVCKKHNLYLFMDGARLGYGLMCKENDMTLADIAANTDVFYIGGTKVGALFGEALVINNDSLKKDFRYFIKQKGGLLAKGRLLGIQFEALFENGLYFEISKHAINCAKRIHDVFADYGYEFLSDSKTNQQFPIISDSELEILSKDFTYDYWCPMGNGKSAVRFCSSWATTEENLNALEKAVKSL